MAPWGLVVFAAIAVLVLLVLAASQGSDTTDTGGRHLSDQTKQKLYYDMIAVQEQYPGFSNEWNQGVKEAAAKSYNVPMSQINDIIREGASKHWLQPSP
jgi:hypothetical protein